MDDEPKFVKVTVNKNELPPDYIVKAIADTIISPVSGDLYTHNGFMSIGYEVSKYLKDDIFPQKFKQIFTLLEGRQFTIQSAIMFWLMLLRNNEGDFGDAW